jgi:hypothetical protein
VLKSSHLRKNTTVENNLSLQAQANFSKRQEIQLKQFLNNPNNFIYDSRKIGEMPPIPAFYQVHLGTKKYSNKNIHVLPF